MPTSCCRQCGSASAVITKRRSDMERSDSDALVIFGATGDLCFKKIFPALYNLVRRGHLSVPVIGVARAGWNLEKLADHVREIVQASVKPVDDSVLKKL